MKCELASSITTTDKNDQELNEKELLVFNEKLEMIR